MYQYHHELREIPADALVRKRDVVGRTSARTGHSRQYYISNATTTTALQGSINLMKRIWNALPEELVAHPNPITITFKRLTRKPEIYTILIKSVEAVRRTELSI